MYKSISYKKQNNKKQAYIYLRVSSEEQITNFSLDNQHDYCKKEAERLGLEITGVYREEGVSAKTINRPKLIRLLEDCRLNKNKISAILIYKIDRLSRDTYDYLAIKRQLSKYEIRIISVTEPTEASPTGEFLETMLAASAKLDNATKSLRTIDGMRKRIEAGWANGKAPAGYVNVIQNNKCVIEPDNEQFDTMKKVWEEMATGIYSTISIIPVFQKLGLIIKRGTHRIPITRCQQTQRIFRDKFYCGYVVSKKFGIDKVGNHTPMISEALFYKVQAIIDGRSFTSGIQHNKQNEIFPLRGVLCDKCGRMMTGSVSSGRDSRYPYYFCGHSAHFSPSIPKKDFEIQFLAFMRKIEPKKELVFLFSEMVRERWLEKFSNIGQRQEIIDKEIAEFALMKQQLVQKNLKGIYSDELFKEQVELIDKEIAIKKSYKYSSDLAQIDIDGVVKFMNDFLWNIASAWEKGSLQQRKLLTGSIFPQNIIYCYPDFRTTQLGPCFALMGQFRADPSSKWVTDGS